MIASTITTCDSRQSVLQDTLQSLRETDWPWESMIINDKDATPPEEHDNCSLFDRQANVSLAALKALADTQIKNILKCVNIQCAINSQEEVMKFLVVEEYGYRVYSVTTSLSLDKLISWWTTVVPKVELPGVDFFSDLPGLVIRLNPKNRKFKYVCHLHGADDSDFDGIVPTAWLTADNQAAGSRAK